MKHKRILGYSALGLTLAALSVAFVKPISTSNILFRVHADMSNLSVTFNSSGAQSHIDNYTYYRSANTSLGNTFYLRNRSNINPQSNQVAVMCGNSEKGSIENEIIFTTTNTGTSLFEFKNILSISAVSNSSSTRTLTVFKSSDGTNWNDAGSLAFNSSGGTNTDVSGAKYIKLTYPSAYFTVYITSFTINYSCSNEPEPEKELSSISVSGQTTEFTVGDSFEFGGTVTAHYSDSSTADVTSDATFTGYDMGETGEQTVTVSYTEDGITKTTTYSITVSSGEEPQTLSGTYFVSISSYVVYLDFDINKYYIDDDDRDYCFFTYVLDGSSITFGLDGSVVTTGGTTRRLFNSAGASNTGSYNSSTDKITVSLFYTFGSETSKSYTFSKV